MAVSGTDIKNCKYFVVPKTRTDWWLNKINSNIANDTKAIKALEKEGWKIINIWECQLKPAMLKKTLTTLLQKIYLIPSNFIIM